MRACLILPLLLLACPAAAGTILVDHAGSGDYLTIEDGIDAASYGDTVLVACGTYYEHDIAMKSGICLVSETGEADCVTIDAGELSRIFHCSGTDSTTVFAGLTLTNGLSPDEGGAMFCENSFLTLTNCAFENNLAHNEWGHAYGGGISFDYSSATILDCAFTGNISSSSWPHGNAWGGAIYMWHSGAVISGCDFSENCSVSGGAVSSESGDTLFISDCVFSENPGNYGGALYSGETVLEDCLFVGNGFGYSHGGGANLGHGSTVTRCTFEDNVAEFYAGMWLRSGTVTDCVFSDNSGDYIGGVCAGGYSVFERCTFVGNHSGWTAGGIQLYDGGTISECVVMDNVAERFGGGILCGTPHEGPMSIIDCVVSDNEAFETGGGIACVDTLPILIQGCTISGNTAWGGGGAISAADGAEPVVERTILAFSHAGGSALCDSTSTLTLLNCDVFGNEEGDWVDCIAGQESSGGNFSLDPLFCDMYSADFSLCANSPCLPAAGGQRDLVGALGQGCDSCDSPVEDTFYVGACSERVVTLRWTMESSSALDGLDVYRATESDGPFTKLNDALLSPLSPGAYVDTTVWPATTFLYRLKGVGHDGSERLIGDTVTAMTPGSFPAVFHAPTPNPFTDLCSVVLDLPSPSQHAIVAVFDISGRRVVTLHDAPLPRGRREFSWDGRDDTRRQCSSGIYFLQCDAGHTVLRQRVALMR